LSLPSEEWQAQPEGLTQDVFHPEKLLLMSYTRLIKSGEAKPRFLIQPTIFFLLIFVL